MIVQDPVYGDIHIENSIVEELIGNGFFERLKDITQSGMPNGLNKFPSFSRFEHSIGVYYLLQKFQANRNEQIAGLLHDIAHRAFSHVYEWIVDENQSNIEGISESDTSKFLQHPSLLAILDKHGICLEELSNYMDFSILENDIPDLCADRLDYSFREYLMYKNSNDLYEKLRDKIHFSHDIKSFYFQDEESAELYGYEFLELQENVWGSWDSVFRYQAIREIAIQLMNGGEIILEDFDNGESKILAKFYGSTNIEVQKYVQILKQKEIEPKPVFQKNIVKKFRFVDPYTMLNGKFVRMSSLSDDFKATIEKASERNKFGQLV